MWDINCLDYSRITSYDSRDGRWDDVFDYHHTPLDMPYMTMYIYTTLSDMVIWGVPRVTIQFLPSKL